jgi:hypothetical protein
MSADLLSRPHLSIITRQADAELERIQSTIAHKLLVDGRADLEAQLGALLDLRVAPAPKTLDLIGHTTSDRSLLLLGDWVIDATSPTVTSFFRGLADDDVLPRLGIHAVRLLGCMTADSAHGRWTICKLADILGIEVLGTTGLMFASHYDENGLSDDRRYLLTQASELRDTVLDPRPLDRGSRDARVLDLDGVPPVAPPRRPWPVRLADADAARAVLRLVRRRDGSVLPGLLASPACELAFPAGPPGHYHLLQVLLDGEVVRVYPDGDDRPGVVYPVDDPHELKRMIDVMPHALP